MVMPAKDDNKQKRKSLLSKPELLGAAIIIKGGQITRVNQKLFLVKSQSGPSKGNTMAYEVRWKKNRWTCQCPSSAQKRKLCEHIHAVNILLKLPAIITSNADAIEGGCPYCGANDIIMKGFRYNKSGYVRRFLCKNCRKKFKNPVSGEDVNSNISLLMIVFDLYFKKLSLAEIKEHLWQVYGIEKATSTLYDWITRFTELLGRATKKINVTAGRKILIDEMVVRVNGMKKYLWNVLDFESRYYLVSLLTRGRSTNEASLVIKRAIEKLGRRPKTVVTDGLESYCTPLQAMGIKHVGNVGLAKYKNNNRIERLNGTVRSFIRAKRGLKNRAAEMINTHRTYYNDIRPHSAIKKMTPSGKKNPRWSSLLQRRKGRGRFHK